MTTRNLQLYSRLPNGDVWADPIDPDYTVRFKTNAQPKVLDGMKTTNYVTEIIVNDNGKVSVGGLSVSDARSVRIRTSGAIESIADLKAMCSDACNQLVSAWLAENVLTGFPVTTPPSRTVS